MEQNTHTHTPGRFQPHHRFNLIDTDGFKHLEQKYASEWTARMDTLFNQLVVLKNPTDKKITVKRSIDSTRYSKPGQLKLKKKIYERLGTYPGENGILLTLTMAGLDSDQSGYEGTSRLVAWRGFGYRTRAFMDRVNKLRQARGLSRVKRYIKVLEDQKGRSYPCPHIWFPGLKWLAKVEDIQRLWPYGNVDISFIENTTPANYIIKYIAKMEGREFMHVMIWHYRLRLFSTSRGFRYIYKDKTDSGWRFHSSADRFRTAENIDLLLADGYSVEPSELIQPRGS